MKNNKESKTVRDISLNVKNAAGSSGRFKRIAPKILCVFAAFVLWLYVMQVESPEYETTISGVTVGLENTSKLESESGLSVYSGAGTQINVTISGKKSIISKIKAEDIIATVDVSRIKEAGRHPLDVSYDLPEEVALADSSSQTVTVYVDETSFVSLPVKEKMENMVLSSPYELGTIEFEYNSINVSGPKNKIDTLAEAQVSVNMQNKTSSFVIKCPITLVDSKGESVDTTYLQTSISEMNVKVPIYTTMEIPVNVTFKHGLLNKDLAKITTVPETVTVKGDASELLAENVMEAIVIDEKQITGSNYTLTVYPKFSSNVTLADEKQEIKITVDLDSSLRTKQYNCTDIQITGASSGLSYEIVDESISVTLRGTLDQLSKIKDSDISIIADMSGYGEQNTGTVSRTASVVVDAENSEGVFEIGEYTVQVKISE